jgi:Xaa-Pro aminopeptidase
VADVVIYADSIRSPEMRHEVPVPVPDPFAYVEHGGRRYVFVSSYEVPRIEEGVPDVELLVPEQVGYDDLLAEGYERWRLVRELVLRACREIGVGAAYVPATFPLELADHLRANGIEVTPDDDVFAERRRVKTQTELEGIRRAQRACEAAMDVARELLRSADRSNGTLVVDGEPLTCERIRSRVDDVFNAHGVFADESIVSHGAQTAIGHEMGHGAIAPNEPVVLDLFPRDRATGCYADMTRTFVVGEASDELREYHRLVKEALERSTAQVRAGARGRALFEGVCELFQQHGYPTQLTKPPGEILADGFFHSLGHGIGLEVHEQPLLGRAETRLVAGDVVTIEPGLYRRGYGGVRLEDLVLVTDDGPEVLTQYPYDLEP